MGNSRSVLAGTAKEAEWSRTSLQRLTASVERDFIYEQDGLSVAAGAEVLWSLEYGLQLLPPMEQGRGLGADHGRAQAPGSPGKGVSRRYRRLSLKPKKSS